MLGAKGVTSVSLDYDVIEPGLVLMSGELYDVGVERIAAHAGKSSQQVGRDLRGGKVPGAVFLDSGLCSGRYAALAPMRQLDEGQTTVTIPPKTKKNSPYQVVSLPENNTGGKWKGPPGATRILILEAGLSSREIRIDVWE